MEALGRFLSWVPVCVAVNQCCVSVQPVPGDDMRPTLNPGDTQDVCFLERVSTKLYRYTRGSVVVLRSPTEPRRLLVRRLIGLEGDWVCRQPGSSSQLELVPKGCCWLEGDDPAAREGGAVPLALLEGRATHVLWPPSRWGSVPARLPPGRILALGGSDDAELSQHW